MPKQILQSAALIWGLSHLTACDRFSRSALTRGYEKIDLKEVIIETGQGMPSLIIR